MNFNFIDSRSVWNEIKGMTFLSDLPTSLRIQGQLLHFYFIFVYVNRLNNSLKNMKTFIQYLQLAIILKIKMNVVISNITRAMTTSKHVAD